MVGKFAISRAGHDKEQVYVIVAKEGDFVYLCDGKYRPVQKPKKKRRKHIQIIEHTVDEELQRKLRKAEMVTNEQIKYAIKKSHTL